MSKEDFYTTQLLRLREHTEVKVEKNVSAQNRENSCKLQLSILNSQQLWIPALDVHLIRSFNSLLWKEELIALYCSLITYWPLVSSEVSMVLAFS